MHTAGRLTERFLQPRTALAPVAPLLNAADLTMKPTYQGPSPAVAPAPVYNWTGFYIGGGFGYGMFNIDDSVSELGRLVSANETWGGRGWFGTLVGGYDYQFANPFAIPFFSNPLVAGVFVDADFGDIKGSVGSTDVEGSARIGERRVVSCAFI